MSIAVLASFRTRLKAGSPCRTSTALSLYTRVELRDDRLEIAEAREFGGDIFCDAVDEAANVAGYLGRRAKLLEEGASALRVPAPPHLEGGRQRSLDEHEAKSRLAQAGIPVPAGMMIDGVVPGIGFPGPYAVKLLSSEVTHKSDIGGVRLGARNEAEILAAAEAIAASVRTAAPAIGSSKFPVEEMVTDAVGELLIGLRRDPHLGLAIVLGSGGVAVELYQDRKILLLPVTRAQVRNALLERNAERLWDARSTRS